MIVRVLIAILMGLCPLGVAAITNIHHRTANNERQKESKHVLLGLNISNNTSLMPSIDKSPSIDSATTSRNVSTVHGESAYLVCSVMNLGHNVVSWLRHKDMNVLSSGKDKYTQDPRYRVFHDDNTWTLKIKQARKDDEGFFDCQISTTPLVSHTIYLNVIDPEVELIGEDGGNKLASVGSNLNLTCFIRQMPDEAKALRWTHGDEEINHQSPRGGVFIITEHNSIATVSHLVIKNLTMADSGEYSCSVSAKSRATVRAFVINDEAAEAVVTFNESIKTSSTFYILFSFAFVALVAWRSENV